MVGRVVPNAPSAYFFGSDDFDNSTGGGFAELEVSAVVNAATNDFVSVATNRVFVPPANETYAYDADGNQTLVTTGTGTWQVEYNGENRPVKWTRVSPDSSTPSLVSMSYDHQGRRRLYVEVAAGVTNSLHRFTYDDYLCIARNREVDARHGIGSDGFVWDPTEPVATRPLMCNPSTAPLFLYCHDGNKNVSEIVDVGTGEISAHYEYSSFGKVVLVTSERGGNVAAINPYRFSSEYHDGELGLVYYNYRHYNPGDGRWMSRDPGDDYAFALYAFCNNNFGFDMLGLMPRLGELLIISGSLEKLSRNPVVKFTGYGSVFFNAARCLMGLAFAVGNPPECVVSEGELHRYNSECISGARKAIAGCVGNLFGAIGSIAAGGKGFVVSLIASQVGNMFGNMFGSYASEFISSEWLQDTFCEKQPIVNPCCGK